MRASTKECNGDDCRWWFRTMILESFKCRFSRRFWKMCMSFSANSQLVKALCY
ncbi:hypothetical protein HanIR_Chr11g0526211 [Helianthus annuus]|nr:hypothetical protein HanIR_Chr11g0526211 [Helianthus annuus]